MKPSHFQTPRTQNECTYWMGGDPFERPMRRSHYSPGRWLAFAIVVIVALAMLGGAA